MSKGSRTLAENRKYYGKVHLKRHPEGGWFTYCGREIKDWMKVQYAGPSTMIEEAGMICQRCFEALSLERGKT